MVPIGSKASGAGLLTDRQEKAVRSILRASISPELKKQLENVLNSSESIRKQRGLGYVENVEWNKVRLRMLLLSVLGVYRSLAITK